MIKQKFPRAMSYALIVACASSVAACQVAGLKPEQSSSSEQTVSAAPQEVSSFNEPIYLLANPEVKDQIKAGKYKSGLEHFEKVGLTTKKPDGESYESFFTGTSGNDTIKAIGQGEHTHFSGVDLEVVPGQDGPLPLRPKSLGTGEVDILVGTTEGSDEFLVGSFITSVNSKPQPFYIGKGDADYARIKNFNKSKDSIILAGFPEQYQLKSVDGDFLISTKEGDLVAIVEGVDRLDVEGIYKEFGVSILK
ncbi:MAG: hypothetical protein IGQ88_07140 [Gloeomargaritaceae cyanobacterium C42_A2020_066]|nr:hypothetical protein [Gloeomargaritaceae cyanobacterium C42_A2020_066]